MYFVYSLILALGMLLLLPWFFYQALRHKKYLVSAYQSQRLGFLPKGLVPPGESSIWIHAVSVGEVLAVVPLARRIKELFPDLPLLVSTTTLTGQEMAKARLGGPALSHSTGAVADGFFYFPFDWPGSVRRALRRAKPKLVIIAETEIWPHFLREAARAGIPVVFVNSRISDRSFGRYQKVKWFTRSVLAFPAAFLAQTEEDRRRLIELGAPAEKVRVSGNLKYDLAEPPATQLVEELLRGIALHGRESVLVAGSTMPGEEEIIGAAFAELQGSYPKALWVLAPRHPERFDAVADWVFHRGWRLLRRSQMACPEPAPSSRRACPESSTLRSQTDGRSRRGDLRASAAGQRDAASAAENMDWPEVLLVDSMGELAGLYRLATVAYIGGSLVRHGGHNPLEPALFARPIVFGASMENFREMARALVNEGAAAVVTDGEELKKTLLALSADEARRQRMGQAARAFVERHRGATERAVAVIREILAVRPAATTRVRS